ncbi:MAG: cobalamin-binding protein [Planctomycetota bacterium]|nr:cobalamin-binding protein [Planctomycetota bacterium]
MVEPTTGSSATASPATASPATVPSSLSAGSARRIVSLVPSATEIVAAIGAGDRLVGRSHECDFPRGVQALPVVIRPRIDGASMPGGVTPAEIDAKVRAAMHAADSLYELDVAALAQLNADLVITQDLCGVCAVDGPSVERALASLLSRPRVLSLAPMTIEDVLDDLGRVAEAIGDAHIIASARATLVQLRERLFSALDYVNPFADGPSVAVLDWLDPLYIAGHWTPQIVERAGGRHGLNATVADASAGAATGPQASSRRAGPSRAISHAELVEAAPEYLIVCPCGVPLDAAMRQIEAHAAGKAWFESLPAVRLARAGKRRVAIVDGNQFFSRPGPRLVDALEWTTAWLNDRPELTPPGFSARMWP